MDEPEPKLYDRESFPIIKNTIPSVMSKDEILEKMDRPREEVVEGKSRDEDIEDFRRWMS